jgi:predicted  nucleic acid-binding Zn ribbon protein
MMHRPAAYILYVEYFPSVSCIHSAHRVLPIGQLHTLSTQNTSHCQLHIFCKQNTSNQSAAHILQTEYFPSFSCIYFVHGIYPIGQAHTFCTRNTSHRSAAYILYMAHFPSVSCIHSIYGTLLISQLQTFCTQNTSHR